MSERISQRDVEDSDWSAAMARKERAAMAQVSDAYVHANRQALPLWEDMYQRLAQARAEGYTDEQLAGMIWHEQRLASAMIESQRRYEQAAEDIFPYLDRAEMEASQLAYQSVAMQTQLALADAPAGFSFNAIQFPQQAFEVGVGRTAEGTALHDLLVSRFGDTAGVVKQELIASVALGIGPRETMRRVRERVGGHYGRLDVLVRTELLGVYRKSTHNTFKANRHLLRGWRWSAALSPRTCPVCWAMHGSIHDIDEPMETHPACRCSMRPVVRPWNEINPLYGNIQAPPEPTGPELFDRLPESQQRQILGPLAFEAYQGRHFRLDDLVEQTWSNVWGGGRKRRSLVTVLGPDRYRALRAGTLAPRQRRPRRTRPKPEPAVAPAGPKQRRPVGTPVSESMWGLDSLPKRGATGKISDHMRAAVKNIDATHGDGQLPPVPLRLMQSRTAWGHYKYRYAYDGGYEPMEIAIAKGAQHARLTMAHEVGHFLDQQWLGKANGVVGYGSVKHIHVPGMTKLIETIDNSRAVRQLVTMLHAGSKGQRMKGVFNGREVEFVPDITYLRYAVSHEELYARSYAQYIATRSGDPEMLRELDIERDPARSAYHAVQWADDDFEPIAAAFDELFRLNGGLADE